MPVGTVATNTGDSATSEATSTILSTVAAAVALGGGATALWKQSSQEHVEVKSHTGRNVSMTDRILSQTNALNRPWSFIHQPPKGLFESQFQFPSVALYDNPLLNHSTNRTEAEPRRKASVHNNRRHSLNVMLTRMKSVSGRGLNEKYKVDWNTVLGEGAFGSVHPARLALTGEKVALKKISKRYTNSSTFLNETNALLRQVMLS